MGSHVDGEETKSRRQSLDEELKMSSLDAPVVIPLMSSEGDSSSDDGEGETLMARAIRFAEQTAEMSAKEELKRSKAVAAEEDLETRSSMLKTRLRSLLGSRTRKRSSVDYDYLPRRGDRHRRSSRDSLSLQSEDNKQTRLVRKGSGYVEIGIDSELSTSSTQSLQSRDEWESRRGPRSGSTISYDRREHDKIASVHVDSFIGSAASSSSSLSGHELRSAHIDDFMDSFIGSAASEDDEHDRRDRDTSGPRRGSSGLRSNPDYKNGTSKRRVGDLVRNGSGRYVVVGDSRMESAGLDSFLDSYQSAIDDGDGDDFYHDAHSEFRSGTELRSDDIDRFMENRGSGQIGSFIGSTEEFHDLDLANHDSPEVRETYRELQDLDRQLASQRKEVEAASRSAQQAYAHASHACDKVLEMGGELSERTVRANNLVMASRTLTPNQVVDAADTTATPPHPSSPRTIRDLASFSQGGEDHRSQHDIPGVPPGGDTYTTASPARHASQQELHGVHVGLGAGSEDHQGILSKTSGDHRSITDRPFAQHDLPGVPPGGDTYTTASPARHVSQQELHGGRATTAANTATTPAPYVAPSGGAFSLPPIDVEHVLRTELRLALSGLARGVQCLDRTAQEHFMAHRSREEMEQRWHDAKLRGTSEMLYPAENAQQNQHGPSPSRSGSLPPVDLRNVVADAAKHSPREVEPSPRQDEEHHGHQHRNKDSVSDRKRNLTINVVTTPPPEAAPLTPPKQKEKKHKIWSHSSSGSDSDGHSHNRGRHGHKSPRVHHVHHGHTKIVEIDHYGAGPHHHHGGHHGGHHHHHHHHRHARDHGRRRRGHGSTYNEDVAIISGDEDQLPDKSPRERPSGKRSPARNRSAEGEKSPRAIKSADHKKSPRGKKGDKNKKGSRKSSVQPDHSVDSRDSNIYPQSEEYRPRQGSSGYSEIRFDSELPISTSESSGSPRAEPVDRPSGNRRPRSRGHDKKIDKKSPYLAIKSAAHDRDWRSKMSKTRSEKDRTHARLDAQRGPQRDRGRSPRRGKSPRGKSSERSPRGKTGTSSERGRADDHGDRTRRRGPHHASRSPGGGTRIIRRDNRGYHHRSCGAGGDIYIINGGGYHGGSTYSYSSSSEEDYSSSSYGSYWTSSGTSGTPSSEEEVVLSDRSLSDRGLLEDKPVTPRMTSSTIEEQNVQPFTSEEKLFSSEEEPPPSHYREEPSSPREPPPQPNIVVNPAQVIVNVNENQVENHGMSTPGGVSRSPRMRQDLSPDTILGREVPPEGIPGTLSGEAYKSARDKRMNDLDYRVNKILHDNRNAMDDLHTPGKVNASRGLANTVTGSAEQLASFDAIGGVGDPLLTDGGSRRLDRPLSVRGAASRPVVEGEPRALSARGVKAEMRDASYKFAGNMEPHALAAAGRSAGAPGGIDGYSSVVGGKSYAAGSFAGGSVQQGFRPGATSPLNSAPEVARGSNLLYGASMRDIAPPLAAEQNATIAPLPGYNGSNPFAQQQASSMIGGKNVSFQQGGFGGASARFDDMPGSPGTLSDPLGQNPILGGHVIGGSAGGDPYNQPLRGYMSPRGALRSQNLRGTIAGAPVGSLSIFRKTGTGIDHASAPAFSAHRGVEADDKARIIEAAMKERQLHLSGDPRSRALGGVIGHDGSHIITDGAGPGGSFGHSVGGGAVPSGSAFSPRGLTYQDNSLVQRGGLSNPNSVDSMAKRYLGGYHFPGAYPHQHRFAEYSHEGSRYASQRHGPMMEMHEQLFTNAMVGHPGTSITGAKKSQHFEPMSKRRSLDHMVPKGGGDGGKKGGGKGAASGQQHSQRVRDYFDGGGRSGSSPRVGGFGRSGSSPRHHGDDVPKIKWRTPVKRDAALLTRGPVHSVPLKKEKDMIMAKAQVKAARGKGPARFITTQAAGGTGGRKESPPRNKTPPGRASAAMATNRGKGAPRGGAKKASASRSPRGGGKASRSPRGGGKASRSPRGGGKASRSPRGGGKASASRSPRVGGGRRK
ncbi:unnamed protein product [Amoebophrya sp. A25]|nr:unnamed protein product [Amoebophrya sp. A25]|eukprot:GSA25T00014702001.1